jgi:hypothetical protein
MAQAYANGTLLNSNKSIYDVVQISSTSKFGSGYSSSGTTPIINSFNSSAQSSNFIPLAGRAFNITLYGTFVATVQLERSFDGGINWFYITSNGFQLFKFNSICSEQYQEDQVGVLYRLNCISYTSGTINYRLEQ